jgi:S-DNA-T family DNA segregation ATPase FtsK/SpoIIIE
MDLKLVLHNSSGPSQDVLLSLDRAATVADLAAALTRTEPAAPRPAGPLTVALTGRSGRWESLPRAVAVAESGLQSGMSVALAADDGSGSSSHLQPVATVRILTGPEAGQQFDVMHGESTIGRSRSSTIRLTDPLVSKRHAVLRITNEVEIVDADSANGIQINGQTVDHRVLTADTVLNLGETALQVRMHANAGGVARRPTSFNRSPLLDAPYAGVEEELPDVPEPPASQALPILSMLLPLILGAALLFFTRSAIYVLFIALSPLMLAATWLENWHFARREFRKQSKAFRAELAAIEDHMQSELRLEEQQRRAEYPAVSDVSEAIWERGSLLWSRHPQRARFLELRLGLTTCASRSKLKMPHGRRGDASLREEATALVGRFGQVEHVPTKAALADGALGVAGPRPMRLDVTRALVMQLVGLHSPDELTLSAVLPDALVPEWEWLRWLPHTISERAVVGRSPLAADAEACQRVVAAIEQLVEDRRGLSGSAKPGTLPAIVVLVEDGPPVERGRLVELAESGLSVGVYVIWCADQREDLPAECRTLLDLALDGRAWAGYLEDGSSFTNLSIDRLSGIDAEALARSISPLVDAGAMGDRQSELPRAASFLEHTGGRAMIESIDGVAERWREGGSLIVSGQPRKPGTLRALVGRGVGAPFHLDLREQGPHALVGGTTGSGKSEFLQSWILGLALAHSPRRVTFLFVDYKGGSAFSDCVKLPHAVGLVTDLTPRLVRRALTSLKAELRYRERVLNDAGVPDLISLERSGGKDVPPSLVIVVDEFAALVQEVPDFVDGVIDVAQRGRSLGLHLILATQRPAGVIKDNLRANTNLRVALRMADEDDSTDVIGSADAAMFDPSVPGRALAKTGPRRVTPFQALYAGGRTPASPPPPPIEVASLQFGPPVLWEAPKKAEPARVDDGPTDVQQVVDTVTRTADRLELAKPRKPWLQELPRLVELAELDTERSDAELVFGLGDDPDRQSRVVMSYRPDDDGAMAILGTGGSGKSTALRTLALAAATACVSARLGSTDLALGPCHVYGLDFGSRGLAVLEVLPHVGSIISSDDGERITRLLTSLRDLVDERAVTYSRLSAGSIGAYRSITRKSDEPRILLLVDNFPAFRQAYEVGRYARLFEIFQGLALDGRQVGVHVVITADRPGAIPPSLAASVQKRLVLKLVQESDLATAGLKDDAFGDETVPGRGYLNGLETQVAVRGSSANATVQGDRIKRVAEIMVEHGVSPANKVKKLPEIVRLSDLDSVINGQPALGFADDTLAPIGFSLEGPLLVVGPPQSGRSTVLAALVSSLARARPELPLLYVGRGRSLVMSSAEWTATATTSEEIDQLAQTWTEKLAGSAGRLEFAVVIESIPDFNGDAAEMILLDLITKCASVGNPVIAEGETSVMASSWPLMQAVRSPRHGLVLQPDQMDGDAILRTSFPRLDRAEFPPGRGLYVRSGKFRKVQVAMPD